MGKHAQIVMGPAGSGKSTYCNALYKHCEAIGRPIHIVNLDPAAENFEYPVAIDIRDLISLSDVIEELNYGPNGGLVYCMEFLMENFSWLSEQINDYGDDYLVFDCPGQIELYTHLPVMQRFVGFLQKQCNYTLCAIYLLDSLFVSDPSRFVSGALMCLSAMVQLELPHINILSKCDLLPDKRALRRFLDPDVDVLMEELTAAADGRPRRGAAGTVLSFGAGQQAGALGQKYHHLNRAISQLLAQYSMVNFFPLDITDEDSLGLCLQHVDRATAYGEDLEPKEPKDGQLDGGLDTIQE